jgi:SAM-dependent methyltransferase
LTGQDWKTDVGGKLFLKEYASYEEYVRHQGSKLGKIDWLKTYHSRFLEALKLRIRDMPGLRHGATVLCLGARTGAECEAFHAFGALSVGIDLNPGEENKYVLFGDFHALQFPNAVFDIVYTNAIDHAADLGLMLSEVRRVLKIGGVFNAEIVLGSKDDGGRDPGEYESLWWDNVQIVVDRIVATGFWVTRKRHFEYPWRGVNVEFVLCDESPRGSND